MKHSVLYLLREQQELLITKQQEVWKEERERGISRMKGLLKFITCGRVDDGKSTLIGRLLFDSKKLYEDQLISREEYEKSEVALKQAREERQTAKDNLEIVKEGITKNSASFSSTLIRSTIDGLILDITDRLPRILLGLGQPTNKTVGKANYPGTTVRTCQHLRNQCIRQTDN